LQAPKVTFPPDSRSAKPTKLECGLLGALLASREGNVTGTRAADDLGSTGASPRALLARFRAADR
jgi:hypothetical protein